MTAQRSRVPKRGGVVPGPVSTGSENVGPPIGWAETAPKRAWDRLPSFEDWGRKYAATGIAAKRTVGPSIPGGDRVYMGTEIGFTREPDANLASELTTSRRELKRAAREQQGWGWIEAQREALVTRTLRGHAVPEGEDRDEHAARLIRARVKARLGLDLYECIPNLHRELAPISANYFPDAGQLTEAGRRAAQDDAREPAAKFASGVGGAVWDGY